MSSRTSNRIAKVKRGKELESQKSRCQILSERVFDCPPAKKTKKTQKNKSVPEQSTAAAASNLDVSDEDIFEVDSTSKSGDELFDGEGKLLIFFHKFCHVFINLFYLAVSPQQMI